MTSEHKRAFGVFVEREPLEGALNELKSSGFPMDKISVIGKDVDQNEQLVGAQVQDKVGSESVRGPEGAIDATNSAAWGSVLAGLTSLSIPGLGPVIAAGSVGVALVSAVAGTGIAAASSHNLVKALSDLGIPKADAEVYSDQLQGGNYLLMLDGADNEISSAEGVFSNRGIQDWAIYPATSA